MFTHRRIFAAAAVTGALAITAPVATASIGHMPTAGATAGASVRHPVNHRHHGYGNPRHRHPGWGGYGNGWNGGGGTPRYPGDGYGSGNGGGYGDQGGYGNQGGCGNQGGYGNQGGGSVWVPPVRSAAASSFPAPRLA
jgi:hypothetical protein